jgi:hypothetical protein
MREEKKIEKVLSFFFWVILLGLAVVIPNFFNNSIWTIVSLPLVLKFAYDSFDHFNLFVNRFFLWLFSRDVNWELKADFKGDFKVSDLDNILAEIKKLQKIRILQRGQFERTFSIPDLGMVIKISLNKTRNGEDEFSSYIILAVQRVVVSFRHSTRTLNLLISIFNDAVNKCIDTSNAQYEFKAFFVTTNPYFGLFIRRLKVIGMPRVNISYKEKVGANVGDVEVMTDKISLVTRDIQSLQALSHKYLTLSSLNLAET